MKKRYIILFVSLSIALGCQKKVENDISKTTLDNESIKIENDMIKEVLQSQLEDGKEIPGDEFESHTYTEQDLNAAISLVNDILKMNGYKFPEQAVFNEKIKTIFNRVIDNTSSKQNLYFNFYEPCNKDAIYSRIEALSYGLFASKSGYFVTSLYAIPEIIDYQTKYPELKSIEDKKILKKEPDLGKEIEIPHWKDVEGLKEKRKKNILTLVARNMYLFNDSNAHGLWLRQNDKFFMESLIKVFGYVKDPVLLKWVLDGNLIQPQIGNEEQFGKVFWTKTCDNKLIIHQETLSLIEKADKETKAKYLENLSNYMTYLIDKKHYNGILSFPERAKLVANLGYFGETEAEKSAPNFTYQFFSTIQPQMEAYEAEFEKNKNYNLPKFKEVWEATKTGGIGLPM